MFYLNVYFSFFLFFLFSFFFFNMKAHLLYRSGEREFIARRNNDSMKKEKKEENMGKFR